MEIVRQDKNKSGMKFTTSEKAINAIKGFEGLRTTAYKCPAGVWTIGYGNTSHARAGLTINEGQAESYLKEDLAVCEKYVNSEGVCYTQGQFDALVDFCFNLGSGQLRKSTLLKYIKGGRSDSEIQDQFKLWCHSGGKVLPGLVKRCEWRANRWVEKEE